jgi:hypothetical protein
MEMTIRVELATDNHVEIAAAINDLDAACAYLQHVIGQTDGGIAGMFFSDIDCPDAETKWKEIEIGERRDWLRYYLDIERAFSSSIE